jgi:CRISPR-associated protein Csb2
MRVVLEQSFPLGRFHATPWRVNPFDDPHGEWPPSPWRLARSVISRMYQLARETGTFPVRADDLCRALCASAYSFFLPPTARRCPPVRYYQPTGFAWQPHSRTKKVRGRDVLIPGMRGHDRGLVQDNAWAMPENESLLWFLDGELWDPGLLGLLDRCLERIVYFGRAESITTIRRHEGGRPLREANSVLKEQPTDGARVPVLCPSPVATRVELEAVTGRVRGRVLPPGAQWLYATRPPPEPLREPRRPTIARPRVSVVQFVLGVAVPPARTAIVRLTNRFRGRAIRSFVELLTGGAGGAVSDWRRAPTEVRERAAGLAGKDASGVPMEGHRHAHYLLWSDDERHYTRLVVWRKDPFEPEEIDALLRAAGRPLGWAAQGAQADAWRVRLVALPLECLPPPGLDGVSAREWRSVTPFVPPRHHLRPSGRARPEEALDGQIATELRNRGVHVPFDADADAPEWVAVHHPRSAVGGTTWAHRRGYRLRLRFQASVAGPIIIGHSATFGLGLFRPT